MTCHVCGINATVTVTVEITGRPAPGRQREPTIVQLCRRCYRVGGYKTNSPRTP